MKAWAALLDVLRDGRVTRRRLQELDRRLADGDEMRTDPLRGDFLGELHVETERIPEKGQRLVDVLNSDADMVEDGLCASGGSGCGGSACGGIQVLAGTRPTYTVDDFSGCGIRIDATSRDAIHEALKLTGGKLPFCQLQKAMREQIAQSMLLAFPAAGRPLPF